MHFYLSVSESSIAKLEERTLWQALTLGIKPFNQKLIDFALDGSDALNLNANKKYKISFSNGQAFVGYVEELSNIAKSMGYYAVHNVTYNKGNRNKITGTLTVSEQRICSKHVQLKFVIEENMDT